MFMVIDLWFTLQLCQDCLSFLQVARIATRPASDPQWCHTKIVDDIYGSALAN